MKSFRAGGMWLSRVRSAVLALFFLTNVACKESSTTPEQSQFAVGQQLYTAYCASCHEVENGIGPLLKKEVIASRLTAQSLFNYNKRNMPYQAGNSLKDEEYWAITAYLIVRHGFVSEDVNLSLDNANNIALQAENQAAQQP